MLEMSSFYTCVSKTTIIWGTVPEIWSETDRSFYHLGQFLSFYLSDNPENRNFEKKEKASGDVIILHMCTKNHDQMIYASWDKECDRRNFFVILDHFLPFYPTIDPKN